MVPTAELRVAGRTLELGGVPLLMGIVNASPESFSDGGDVGDLDAQVARGHALLEAGADLIDVGGESGVSGQPPLAPEAEAERVVGLIERLVAETGALISVDTYKPAVAAAAVAAGAAIVNDVSGLRDPGLADVCADTGAGLVITHTRAAPKSKVLDHPYADVSADAVTFLTERLALAGSRGVAREQIVLDPGPDFAKNPAQTIAVLLDLAPLHALGRPLLLAISRKDFIGALTVRGPRERLAGTLAALGHAADQGAHIVRVHDVAEARDYLTVRAALRGEADVPARLELPEALRRVPWV